MLWEYHLESAALCLGERVKKGTYRSSINSCIPYSQITGALRAAFGAGVNGSGQVENHEMDLHAVGLLAAFQRQTVTSALRDSVLGVAKLPVDASILTRVEGKVYISINPYTQGLPPQMTLWLGAYRSKGLGQCHLVLSGKKTVDPTQEMGWGRLAVRLPDEPAVLALFGVQEVRMRAWGYLFQPDAAHEGGVYVRSLFEGSIIKGPKFLLQGG